MFIDTHCHFSKEDYEDIDKIIEDNRNNYVDKIIVSGCTRDSIVEALDLLNKYDDVYVTIGYHPSEALITTDEDLKLLKKQLKNNRVVGVGEIGLDYHYGKEDIEQQKTLFRKQLEIAQELSLPVVIHSRDATFDTINILKEFPDVKGDIHCFSGSIETARIYVSMGYKLGIGGVVTFKNSTLPKVVEEIGLSNIVIETDSPYLTPEPFRGKQNSSKYLSLIADKIADIFDLPIEDVSKRLLENTYELFDLE